MKIGIMGGTFDPIHIGHLILGENAWQQFGLDKVLYMPSGNPPHKRNRDGRATNQQRMDMVRLAIAGNPHFEISDREMNEDGYTYTYRTLEGMLSEHPEDELYFIIGADSLFDFKDWMLPERIAAACTLVVATRNHTSTEQLDACIAEVRDRFSAKVEKLETENIDVSSNMIRSLIASDRTIRYYVPDAVADYIFEHRVYDHLR